MYARIYFLQPLPQPSPKGRELGKPNESVPRDEIGMRVCQNGMTGEKALPRSPLLLGGGVRGGGEKYGHNLLKIK
jgi:hypothetical protein